MTDDYVAREALADPMWWPDSHVKLVHDWQRYVSEEIQAMWMTFTPEQKIALARCFQQMADAEEWE